MIKSGRNQAGLREEVKKMEGEKTIIFPIWKNEKTYLYNIKDIIAVVAMWAIRQSPYDYPEKLSEGMGELRMTLLPSFGGECFVKFSYPEIHNLLKRLFEKCPTIMSWNNPKKGEHKMVFVSRYHEPKPDHDFIDLSALARNVAQTLTLERMSEEDK